MTTIWKRSTEDATTPRRARLATLALLLGLLSLTISMLGASKSAAAPGDPFDPLTPYVFIGQESPTSLFRAVAGAGGTVTFSPEGSASGVTYNAIGYNTGTNYIYGVAITGNSAIPTGSVIRIGQGGVVTRVGSTVLPGAFYWGAMGSGNRLYVGNSNSVNFTVINTLTGAVESTGTLASGQTVFDLTYAQGYFWGVNNDGDLVRVDLESTAAAKPVSVFSLGMAAGPYGATWTFGNGNIGISNNGTGLVTQIAITNPGSANPTRTIVATSPGPSSSNNDGAASPGGPTDLSIVKTAPTSFDAGGTLTYSVKVTNNGPSISTGSIVTDLVPAGLTGVQTSTPGCTVLNNRVTGTVGQLTAGASSTITITADTPSTVDKCYTNAASVLANELDPTPDNNSSSVTSCPRALAIEKSSDVTTATRIGDTITYTVTATNTGLGSYTTADPAVLVDDLSGILDDAVYNDDATASRPGQLGYSAPKVSWTGPLGAGQSVTVTYTAETKTGGDGVMRNVAFQPTDPTDPVTPECAPRPRRAWTPSPASRAPRWSPACRR